VVESAPLRLGSAFPDPPFEVDGAAASGLDADLMTAIAAELGRPLVVHHYEGPDFEGIFADLGRGIDVVASGATITEHRKTMARWCDPYLRSGQSLVVNDATAADRPDTDHLRGMTLGVQDGNTSQPVAQALLAVGKIAAVKVYAYREILTALDDLEDGRIGGFMKLEPVLRWLTADRTSLRIVQTGITTELLAVAVASPDAALAAQIDVAQQALRQRGELARIGRRWLSGSDPRATRMLT
jgi:ABC-type amino acid transport substrate-binding protein